MFLEGAITALVTPFHADGSLDLPTLRDHVEYQIDGGIDGILVLGSTGEASTLTNGERDQVVETAVDIVRGRCHLMVGCGTNATATTVDNVRRAEALGATSALVVTPYYNRPTVEGMRRHFLAVMDATTLPICLYNIPKRTGSLLPVSLLDELFADSRIVAIKESSWDMAQVQATLSVAGKYPHVSVLSGDDPLILPLMALGARGVIGVLSNILPDTVVALVRAAQRGDYATALSLHNQLQPLIHAAFIETNPIPIKSMLAQLGRPAGPCRLPLCDLSAAGDAVVAKALEASSLSLAW